MHSQALQIDQAMFANTALSAAIPFTVKVMALLMLALSMPGICIVMWRETPGNLQN